jgi:hypothetical protein
MHPTPLLGTVITDSRPYPFSRSLSTALALAGYWMTGLPGYVRATSTQWCLQALRSGTIVCNFAQQIK